ncbi:MAG: hypothetical protein L0Y76_00945, partial [Ignavibacteria bacterium]|nr:hypothetical protein [Ignavibacteria bacterium]
SLPDPFNICNVFANKPFLSYWQNKYSSPNTLYLYDTVLHLLNIGKFVIFFENLPRIVILPPKKILHTLLIFQTAFLNTYINEETQ